MRPILLLSLAFLPLACCNVCATDDAAPAKDGGWISLFDGRTTDGWRGFRRDDVPEGWQVVDGALTRVAEGGDLVTEASYDDFVLELEWRISPGGNSGILFRVSEDGDATYFSGPEMQVLDDSAETDLDPRHSAGANYALHAPVGKTLAPVGEWNRVRLVARGPHVEQWLNGVKVVEYELWTPEWQRLVAESKFHQWPRYGRNHEGHIALQDHGAEVAYRNIRLKRLP